MQDIETEIKERIVRDPEILGGKPIINGTRIAVQHIVDYMANGISESEIVTDFPWLTVEDVRAALAFYLREVAEYGDQFVAAPASNRVSLRSMSTSARTRPPN